jgi:hypothetical protein
MNKGCLREKNDTQASEATKSIELKFHKRFCQNSKRIEQIRKDSRKRTKIKEIRKIKWYKKEKIKTQNQKKENEEIIKELQRGEKILGKIKLLYNKNC